MITEYCVHPPHTRLEYRSWPTVHPGLDIRDAAGSSNQVLDLWKVCIDSLGSHQLHVCDVEEQVKVSPGGGIPYQELPTPALQLLLQLPHAGGDVCLHELLLSSSILGMVERVPGIQKILDDSNDLPIPGEERDLTPWGLRLECCPWGHIVPRGWQALILILGSCISKQQARWLCSCSQVKICQLYVRHFQKYLFPCLLWSLSDCLEDSH